jgi:hypothetical protein
MTIPGRTASVSCRTPLNSRGHVHHELSRRNPNVGQTPSGWSARSSLWGDRFLGRLFHDARGRSCCFGAVFLTPLVGWSPIARRNEGRPGRRGTAVLQHFKLQRRRSPLSGQQSIIVAEGLQIWASQSAFIDWELRAAERSAVSAAVRGGLRNLAGPRRVAPGNERRVFKCDTTQYARARRGDDNGRARSGCCPERTRQVVEQRLR